MLRKKKLLKYLIFLGGVLTISISFFAYRSVAETIEYKVDLNIKGITEEMDELVNLRDSLSLSSNPYDYIDNTHYDNLVNLGEEAIPILKDRIDTSPNNGLTEYILAIAAEEIANVEIRDYSYKWSTAKNWSSSLEEYVEDIPKKVDKIISSNESKKMKNEKLSKLGIYAIPCIIDNIEDGKVSKKFSFKKMTNEKGIDGNNLHKIKRKYQNIISEIKR